MPFTPFSTASVASSAVMIPFRTRGSEERDRSQAMSFHVTEGSSSAATYLAKAEPRCDSGISSSPAGRTFAIPSPGGSVKAVRSSFSRRPRNGGSQRPLLIGLPIPTEGDLIVRSASDVVERRAWHLRASHLLELEQIREGEPHRRSRWAPAPYAFGPGHILMRTVGTRRRGVPISSSMISGRMVEYPGFSESVPAYLARPSDDHVRPAVVVIHALFGLVDHTKHVADRVAREGYVALAPNLFGTTELASVLTPESVQKAMHLLFRLPRRDPELARQEVAELPEAERSSVGSTVEKLLGGLPKDRFVKDLVAAVDYLRALPSVRRDRIGSVGVCFGGGVAADLACGT